MINLLARNWRLWARIPFRVNALLVLGILPSVGGEALRPPVTIGNGSGHLRYITTDHNNRERYVGVAVDVGAVESQDGALRKAAAEAVNHKPLFKDFMAVNGHFTFKPESTCIIITA